MIIWDKIFTELLVVVGWKQSTTTGDPVVSTSNKLSSSGLYVQGAHPVCTVRNIKATQEDKAISDVNLNVVLTDLVKEGISNVLTDVFPSKDVFSNGMLYKYANDFNHQITTRQGFVGFEINISKKVDIVNVLNKVFLQFSGAGDIELLLFNSDVKTPISSKVIAVTADTVIGSVLDWVIGNITGSGGRWYIGYLNTSLSFNAYDRQFDRANEMTCFNSILFTPIFVNGWDSKTLFDLSKVEYTSESFGLNFDITTAKDYYNLILMNKDRFAKAIQLSTACQALALMTTTSRINPEERVIMNVLGQKVVIDSPQTYNLYSSLEKEIKSLKSLFSGESITTGTLR